MGNRNMKPWTLRRLARVVVLGVLWGFGAPLASGGEPGAGGPTAKEGGGSEPTPADSSRLLREQTIYIPYEKFRRVFEKQGRGVFLPYERFRELWEAATKQVEPAVPAKPPPGQVITEAQYEAYVAKEVVRVKAIFKVDLLHEGWNEVPLRLGDAAVTSATMGGKPARIVSAGPAGHKLLVERGGKAAESVELVLEFAKAIARSPGQNSVSFEVPQAAVSGWRVTIPEAGVKVNVQPAVAVMEVSPAEAGSEKPGSARPGGERGDSKPSGGEKAPDGRKPQETAKPGQQTVVQAFVGAAPSVRIEWTPKAEGAAGLEALATVAVQQQVSVTEGAVRQRVHLAYTVSRAELCQLVLEVPAEQRVVNVADANVRQWRAEPAGQMQRLVVDLFEPAQQSQALVVEMEQYGAGAEAGEGPEFGAEPGVAEKPLAGAKAESGKKAAPGGKPEAGATPGVGERPQAGAKEGAPPRPAKEAEPPSTVRVPVVRAVGVGQQQGLVMVAAPEGLRIEAVRVTGLVQIDAGELPGPLARQGWAYVFRYAGLPFDLRLSMAKVQPRIVADSLIEAELQPERLNLDMLALADVQRAGVFRLELELPAGYRVESVGGRAAAGAAAAPYEAHHIEGTEKPRLVVNFSKKALGRIGLHVALSRELKEPDLLSPTGKTVEVPVGIPRVLAGPEGRATGRVVLLAPASLQVTPIKVESLRRISHREAMEGVESPRPARAGDTRPMLEFAHADEAALLVVAGERRKPLVVVRQFLAAQIEDGAVQYTATFFFQVQYSGVKSLRIDVPKAIAGLIKVPTPEIRYQPIQPLPADVAPEYVAWRISGGKELLGDGQFQFRWTEKIPKLDPGRGIWITVPHLRPREVDLAWGQIVLKKTETIDIAEAGGKLAHLRPIDPQHDLMPGVSAPEAARAYAFYDDYVLAVTAVRYELKDIKQTSIERALLRMVITRADKTAVQALYQIRSAQQRLAIVLPDGAEIDRRPRINGQPVVLEQGEGGQYYVPLAGRGPDDLLLLELPYSMAGSSRLEYPVFPEDPAVQQVYLAVYVPGERVLLARRGPWTDEFSWQSDGLSWRPVCHWEANDLLRWVSQGTGQPPSDLFFPTDGRMYLFSTLRPAEPEVGALHLSTMRSEGLHAAVMGVLAIVGLVLVPAGTRGRVAGAALVVIALLVCGVFAPILARQVMFGVITAVALVAVVWSAAYFWSRRRAGGRAISGQAPSLVPAAGSLTPSNTAQQPELGAAGSAGHPEEAPGQQPSEAPTEPHQEGGKSDA